MVVMSGLATNHAAECDKTVKLAGRGPGNEGDRRRDFEGARHRYDLEGRPRRGDGALGTLAQQGGEVRVIGRLDKQQMRRTVHRRLCPERSGRASSSRAT